jgi:tRNA(Ile)-lysidine synthase
MLTETSFLQIVTQLTDCKNFCIAFSGGLDSSVLLHLITRHPQFNIRAIHVNHGISPNATTWANFCQATCDRYRIPLQTTSINLIKSNQQSLEELARRGRYQVFRESLKQDEILLAAHHQDDQAETLLLQLFRGCGPKGLAAMPQMMALGQGHLARPLLTFSKKDLQAYASEHQIEWQEDESNQNCDFDRNFLRNNVLPLIQTRWPNITNNIARSAGHCANANQFIEGHIAKQSAQMITETGGLSIPLVSLQDEVTQSYIIRHWLTRLNLPLPNSKKLTTLMQQLNARKDAVVLIEWQDVAVRRYGDYLYASTQFESHNSKLILPWDLKSDLVLPSGLGIISIKALLQQGLDVSSLQNVTIRFRQGGERCRLMHRNHSHCLKKLLQSWRIPPWQRDRIPLLYEKDQLKAIIGFAICQ